MVQLCTRQHESAFIYKLYKYIWRTYMFFYKAISNNIETDPGAYVSPIK